MSNENRNTVNEVAPHTRDYLSLVASDSGEQPNNRDIFDFDATSEEAKHHEQLETEAMKAAKKDNEYLSEVLNTSADDIPIEDYGSADPSLLLNQFNKRFTVVRKYYGKCVIIEPRFSIDQLTGMKKLELEPLSEENFRKGYRNIIFKVGEGKAQREMNIADIWLLMRNRRQIERVIFNPRLKPGLQDNGRELNTWTGFSCEPKECNIDELLDFYRDTICDGNEYNFNYLMDMFAYGIQKPWEKWDKAVIMMSEGEGSGKSLAANFYGDLFGPHRLELGDERLLLGDFTGHFDHIAVVIANETALTNPAAVGKTKAIVDNQTFLMHHKGFTPQAVPNMMKLITTTNESHAIAASQTARRWLCLKVSEKKIDDYSYFNRLQRFYTIGGGREGFLWYLKNRDISKFNKYEIVVTDMLKDQKEKSLGAAEKAVLYLLDTGFCPKRHYRSMKEKSEYTTLKDEVKKLTGKGDLCAAMSKAKEIVFFNEMKHIKRYLAEHVPEVKNTSSMKLGDALKRVLFSQKSYDGYPYWHFPDLREARQRFNEAHKIDHKWNDLEVWVDGNDGEETDEF